MITHYLKIAFRIMRKNKTQSLIGIFGLAFGIACFVPAYYWLHYETTYDSFYPDAANIYRIYAVEKLSGKVNERVPGILETKLHDRFPAIENSTCFEVNFENYSAEETSHIRLRTLYTDSAFFRVFPQVFAGGDAGHPLQTMRNMVITESTAIRMFGSVENALGQPIESTLYRFQPYLVSAVVKDPPPNTNIAFDVIHFPEIQKQMTDYMPEEAQWSYFNRQMYVKLNKQTDIQNLAEQLRDITTQWGTNTQIEIRLLPISDIRHGLTTDLPFTLGFIRLFMAAGLLLLFSALFNFLNLYLGHFHQRIREWRQCMVHGATCRQVVFQMMFELVCVLIPAWLLALCLVVTARPALSGLLDLPVEMWRLLNMLIVCGVWVMALILVAGVYPLWRLSRLAFRDLTQRKATGKPVLRRFAVSLQLAVSIAFIIAASVVMMQLRFVNRKDLGFDRQGVIQITGLFGIAGNQRTALMHELASIPQIENITTGGFEPRHEDFTMITEVEWPGKHTNEKPSFQAITTDSHFAEIFHVKMTQGEWWKEGERTKVVLNEEAVRVMGLLDPVGAIIRVHPGYVLDTGNPPLQECEVAGVVSDFHTLSLRSPIYPAIFKGTGFGDGNLYIRVVQGHELEVMKRITAILPDINVILTDARLTSLDELYDHLNRSEQAGLKIFTVLAMVCLLISLFGIYAFTIASTQRRRKEIAIRKVVGAGIRDIVRMFFREYAMQSLIAAIIALPLTYFFMSRWLQGYAYHTNIPWWLLTGIVIAVITLILLTVWKQTLKAARSNPAEVVKAE